MKLIYCTTTQVASAHSHKVSWWLITKLTAAFVHLVSDESSHVATTPDSVAAHKWTALLEWEALSGPCGLVQPRCRRVALGSLSSPHRLRIASVRQTILPSRTAICSVGASVGRGETRLAARPQPERIVGDVADAKRIDPRDIAGVASGSRSPAVHSRFVSWPVPAGVPAVQLVVRDQWSLRLGTVPRDRDRSGQEASDA